MRLVAFLMVIFSAIIASPVQALSLNNIPLEVDADYPKVELNLTPGIVPSSNETDNLVRNSLISTQSTLNSIIEASEVTEVTIDGQTRYSFRTRESQEPHTGMYSNTWKAPEPPLKRHIPEPSAVFGLIAMAGFFATRYQRKKRS